MKVFTKTFGCQMNFADSDEMGRAFQDRGLVPTSNLEEAEMVMVNTCTIRDMAEHKARSYVGRLKEWKDAHPEGLIILTGCAAERAKDRFRKRYPYLDLIVGAKDIEFFPRELDALLARHGWGEKYLVHPDFKSPSISGPTVQYITIMRGCNYNCSYCIVPSVRGREKYRLVEEILNEVRARVAEGGKEIWLLGQTVNSYRPNPAPFPGYDFSNLLEDVNRISGVERIRFTSPHPYYLSDPLIHAIAALPKVCEHIHLPVQSGSNAILQRMKRNYTRESFLDGIRKLRRACPTIAISTDFIVGFPGESEDDFQATLSLVAEADFDSAYCFKYSARPGTPAADMEDDVPTEVKERRINQLLEIVDGRGARKVKSLIGSDQEVLIEEEKEGVVRGKTRSAWRVRIKNTDLKLGQIVSVRITGTHSRELHGELITKGEPVCC